MNKASLFRFFISLFWFFWFGYEILCTLTDGGTWKIRGEGKLYFSDSALLFILTISLKAFVFIASIYFLYGDFHTFKKSFLNKIRTRNESEVNKCETKKSSANYKKLQRKSNRKKMR